MGVYIEKVLELDYDEYNKCRKILNTTGEYFSEGIIEGWAVDFGNDIKGYIDIIAPCDSDEKPWVEMKLEKYGEYVAQSDCEDRLANIFELVYDGNTYAIKVVVTS